MSASGLQKGFVVSLIAGMLVLAAALRMMGTDLAIAEIAGRNDDTAPDSTAPDSPVAAATGPAGAKAQPAAQPPCVGPEGIAELLAAIRKRKAELDKREQMLLSRLDQLEKAEDDLDRRLKAVKAREDRITRTISQAEKAAEQDIAQLTAVYASMKPRTAAEIFARMEPDFAAGFLGRMQPQAAAAIMSAIPPERAYAISVILAGRNAGIVRN